jgi:ElaB/YqjD/DUF883 family membrane-anchored ribosome-binding protein
MSTMLSDKVEQVSGATGDSGSSQGGNAGSDEIRRQVREWKDDVVASLKNDKTWGDPDALDAPRYQTAQALDGVKHAIHADAEEMMHRVEDYVIDHPLKSLCIAAGVGFLIGVMWSH